MKNPVVEPITEDHLVGYDEFHQLICVKLTKEGLGYTTVDDVRGKTCGLCGRGWELTGPGFSDQLFIPKLKKMVHEKCHVGHEAYSEFWDVYGALCGAILFDGMVEVENPYWPKPYAQSAKPSYKVVAIAGVDRSPLATFTIGMRKRVWDIHVAPKDGTVLPPHEALTEAFASEDVTKSFAPDGMLIHAWSAQKMAEYLKLIAQLMGIDRETQLEERFQAEPMRPPRKAIAQLMGIDRETQLEERFQAEPMRPPRKAET